MINFPDFPIYSYEVDIASPFTVNVTLGMTTFATDTIPASSYWGYVSDGTGVGASLDVTNDSSYPSLHATLAQAIVDCLADPAKHNLTTPTLTLYYRKATSPEPRLIVDYNRSGAGFTGTNCTITFPSTAIANLFGHSTTTDLAWNTLTDLASTDFNFAGYWYNHDLTVLEERWRNQESTATEGMYGGTHNGIQWGDPKVYALFMHPIVWAAMIFPYRRADSNFTTMYSINPLDPYNVLETMTQALSDGREFLLYRDDDIADLCWCSNTELFADINSALEDLASGRVFEFTFPIRVKNEDAVITGTNVYVGA